MEEKRKKKRKKKLNNLIAEIKKRDRSVDEMANRNGLGRAMLGGCI